MTPSNCEKYENFKRNCSSLAKILCRELSSYNFNSSSSIGGLISNLNGEELFKDLKDCLTSPEGNYLNLRIFLYVQGAILSHYQKQILMGEQSGHFYEINTDYLTYSEVFINDMTSSIPDGEYSINHYSFNDHECHGTSPLHYRAMITFFKLPYESRILLGPYLTQINVEKARINPYKEFMLLLSNMNSFSTHPIYSDEYIIGHHYKQVREYSDSVFNNGEIVHYDDNGPNGRKIEWSSDKASNWSKPVHILKLVKIQNDNVTCNLLLSSSFDDEFLLDLMCYYSLRYHIHLMNLYDNFALFEKFRGRFNSGENRRYCLVKFLEFFQGYEESMPFEWNLEIWRMGEYGESE